MINKEIAEAINILSNIFEYIRMNWNLSTHKQQEALEKITQYIDQLEKENNYLKNVKISDFKVYKKIQTVIDYDSLKNTKKEFVIIFPSSLFGLDKEKIKIINLIEYWSECWLRDKPSFNWNFHFDETVLIVVVDLTSHYSENPWNKDWFDEGDQRPGLYSLLKNGKKRINKEDITPSSILPIKIKGRDKEIVPNYNDEYLKSALEHLLKNYSNKQILEQVIKKM